MKLQLKRAPNVTTEFDKTNKHSKKYFTRERQCVFLNAGLFQNTLKLFKTFTYVKLILCACLENKTF